MVPVYEWLLADGTPTGCGTEVEFNHWKGEGDRLGAVLTFEPASEDARRVAAWAKYEQAA